MSSWNGLAILAVAALLIIPIAAGLFVGWVALAFGVAKPLAAAIGLIVCIVSVAWLWDN